MARKIGSDGTRTEEAIRAAAVALIARSGFAAVTLRDLARAVDLQPGSLYRYFPSKHALLRTLLVGHLEDLLASWRAARPAGGDPLAALEAFVAFHIRYHTTRRDEVFIANMELRSLAPADYAEVTGLRRAYEASLEEILAAGAAAGRFRLPDVKVATFAIIAMLTGVCTWYREDGRLSRDALVEIHVRLVLEGVGAGRVDPSGRSV